MNSKFFQDDIIVGDDSTVSDRMCKITWIFENREDCIQIFEQTGSAEVSCPHDKETLSRCDFQQKPLEKIYIICIIFIAIIAPISITIVAYKFLITEVEGRVRDGTFIISIKNYYQYLDKSLKPF